MGDAAEEHISNLLAEEGTSADVAPEPTAEELAAEEAAKQQADEEIKAEGDEQEKEQAKQPDKTVPYNALHEERMRRQEVQAELKKNQELLQSVLPLKQQLEELRKREAERVQQEQQVSEAAQLEEDPVGYLTKQAAKLKEELNQIKTEGLTRKEQEQQHREQQEQHNKLLNDIAQQTTEYAQQHAAYRDELNYVMQRWISDMQAVGVTNPQQIDQALTAQAIQLSRAAMANGRNPGEVVTALAQNWGFKPEAPKGDTKEDANKDIDDAMKRLEKGQQAAKTLSGGGGKPAETELSLQNISEMPDNEFDALWDEMERAAGVKGIY